MKYEGAKIEIVLADEDITMKIYVSEEGDAKDDEELDWGQW